MTGALRTWLPLALFAVLWLDLIRQLSYEWSTSDQYAYGWFVPFFSAALLWRRWLDRPGGKDESRKQKAEIFKDHSPLTSGFSFQFSAFPISAFALPAFCFLLFLLLLPLRVIYEINADWPLISWPYTLIVVFATLYAFFLAGGWPWVRHFAFPICFILVAVRWPWRVEFLLTQGLMRVVAAITVEVLGWLNIPALQRGNLIELATGTVGINEACSGIRSMQSTIMASLFLGELYLLRWPLRLIFLALGVLLAFLFNVVRALFLSWQASSAGLNAIDK